MEWERSSLDDEPTIVLRHGGAHVEIAECGATVLRWSVVGNGGDVVELGAGYCTDTEMLTGKRAAFAVMAPFVNRIRDGRYTFDGVEHDLRPAMDAADDEVIHGLARRRRWVLERAAQREPRVDGAQVVLGTTIEAGEHPGYPFAVRLQARYTLTVHTLGIELTATNTGNTPAPVALGWHPYFVLPGHRVIDGLHLSVPAHAGVRVDADLIPLPGDAAYAAVDAGHWELIGATALDTSFLLTDQDATVSSWLRSDAGGGALEVQQHTAQAPVLHVFTSDGLPGAERTAVAMEPVTTIADAYNRPEWAEAVRLEPQHTRSLSATVRYHPDD